MFTGIQAAGKSTFFKACFVDTHIRINLDMLRTRHREKLLIDACLQARQPYVVENTNLTREERARYIPSAKRAGFRVIGYAFRVELDEALVRNALRNTRRRVPEKAVRAAFRRWQPPSWEEGFDALFDVWSSGGEFQVQAIPREAERS
ncbi:AAA family ATPase [Methylocaldum sp. 14B]|uniref:AAA family ATPase n=1 Tax=unclassified Methylocaldum TaxID=2622260 RepID=UPI00197C63E9|nr:AAA family ATPase [Methylocaldum sp. 14B]MBP1152420.1 putative kinase [Methylocaldum sp. RMAD-M]